MAQLHKRFSDEQVIFLFRAYSQNLMSREEIQETLSISRARFFTLWKEYKSDPEAFSISYQRRSPKKIPPEAAIERELLREKALLEDPELPISSYNYSTLRDRLYKQGIMVSLNTIIDRAKKLGCHQPRRKKKAQVERLYTNLISSGVGMRTVRLVHAVLHAALEKAINYGHIGRNPAHGPSLPRYTHSEMKFLDANQATQFLIAAKDSRNEALYYMAIHTSMRQGELFGLKWTDLNWNNGELKIQRQVKRETGKGWTFADPKTKRGR